MDEEFMRSDEYKFFIKTIGSSDQKDGFPKYYHEAQKFIGRQIYEKRLELEDIFKLTRDLIFKPTLPVNGTKLMYLEEAVLWAAINFENYKVNDLFFILKMCFVKLGRSEHQEILKSIFILRFNLEQNRMMNRINYRKNVAEIEKLIVNLATLDETICVFPLGETDHFSQFDERTISYHQIPLFLLIKYYVSNRNLRLEKIFKLINTDSSAQSESKASNDNKLKSLLFLKISFYFFLSLKNNSDEKEFIDEILSFKKNEYDITFDELIKRMYLQEMVDIRKDIGYNYFIPIRLKTEDWDEIKYMVCLSILKGFKINYKKLINYELRAVLWMFNEKG